MGYTSGQHQANRIAAAYGYKIAEGAALSEFQVGEGIIILNKKGEPMMTGQIDDIRETENGGMAVVVGEHLWDDGTYIFRKL